MSKNAKEFKTTIKPKAAAILPNYALCVAANAQIGQYPLEKKTVVGLSNYSLGYPKI